MARNGVQRVKTGCSTCKARKVKCDEGRPNCTRCLQTGRKCDGYTPQPPGSYSWARLLALSSPPTRTLPETESRALAFFRHVAAPTLSRPLDSHFWTHIVLQLSDREPAAKHAVLAISALYEEFHHRRRRSAPASSSRPCTSPGPGPQPAAALWHYNRAVALMQTARDRSLVLLMCLLFVCIEFLRANHQTAIAHCRHGINMLNEPRAKSLLVRQYVEPAFCRLSVFPYFFGATPETFPCRDAGPLPSSSGGAPFRTVLDAYVALNPLLVQSLRLVRSADTYRLDTTPGREPDSSAVQRGRVLGRALDAWFAMFRLCRGSLGAAETAVTGGGMAQLAEMQWTVCKIWTATCFSREESAYDAHMSRFRAIVDLAREAEAATSRCSPSPGEAAGGFTVEMGFAPLLAFVVIKCRCLPLRMAALELMRSMALPQESGWDYELLSAMGRRTIEVEHGVELAEHARCEDFAGQEATLPAEWSRIKDSVMEPESVQVVELRAPPGDGGRLVRKISFLMSCPGGQGLTTRDEWLSIQRL